jgi:hypothetical protein
MNEIQESRVDMFHSLIWSFFFPGSPAAGAAIHGPIAI